MLHFPSIVIPATRETRNDRVPVSYLQSLLCTQYSYTNFLFKVVNFSAHYIVIILKKQRSNHIKEAAYISHHEYDTIVDVKYGRYNRCKVI